MTTIGPAHFFSSIYGSLLFPVPTPLTPLPTPVPGSSGYIFTALYGCGLVHCAAIASPFMPAFLLIIQWLLMWDIWHCFGHRGKQKRQTIGTSKWSNWVKIMILCNFRFAKFFITEVQMNNAIIESFRYHFCKREKFSLEFKSKIS